MIEKILQSEEKRYSIFPLQYPDIWEWYQKSRALDWNVEELDLFSDLHDWENKLNDNERHFIKYVLGFFNQSDGIVNDNLAMNFCNEVQYTEAKFFYTFQMMIENIHSLTYSTLIDTYVKDNKEKEFLFNAIETIPSVKKKADWALNWISKGSFTERLIAFAVVEGIFFSGSFCSIFWLKKRNLMHGLAFANELISRDEGIHCDFACFIYNNHIEYKLDSQKIYDIITEATEIEKEFVSESLPVDLIGMNSKLMKQYIEFVADRLLINLKLKPYYNSPCPFDFMESISLQNKTNFFEKRVAEYNKFSVVNKMNSEDQSFMAEDF